MHKDLIAKVLGVTVKSVYNYEKEKRPIITLLEKYYTDEDIIEFLETGNIKRLEENNISNTKLELHEKILEDNALYSAKEKLKKLFDSNIIDSIIYTRGAKGIFKDILEEINSEDDNYTYDNAKQRFIDYIMGREVTWFSLKNPAKQKLLSSLINKDLSKIECYSIIKNPKDVLDYI